MVLNDMVESSCYSQKNAGLKGLTWPEVDEAEAKIAVIFQSQILHFDPIFSTRKRNVRSVCDGTSKILTQNGL